MEEKTKEKNKKENRRGGYLFLNKDSIKTRKKRRDNKDSRKILCFTVKTRKKEMSRKARRKIFSLSK